MPDAVENKKEEKNNLWARAPKNPRFPTQTPNARIKQERDTQKRGEQISSDDANERTNVSVLCAAALSF